MNFFYISAMGCSSLCPTTYLGTDMEIAKVAVSEMAEECPVDLVMFDEQKKTLFIESNSGWTAIGRAWFVVRYNPGFNYPETVISNDGIFDTLTEAEEYIKANGGDWKLYTFHELQEKMAESLRLTEELKRTVTDEIPF